MLACSLIIDSRSIRCTNNRIDNRILVGQVALRKHLSIRKKE